MSANAKDAVGGSGHVCTRGGCGANIGTPDKQDEHNRSTHMFANGVMKPTYGAAHRDKVDNDYGRD